MRLTNWINPVPGAATPMTGNRVVAVWCAMRIGSNSVIDAGASDVGRVTTTAAKFEEWLNQAADDQDTYARRALLVMACEKAGESTSADRIRTFVKELHHYVHRR